MADPNEMEIDLFGETYTLNLEAGCLRLAQMKGKGIEPGSLEELEDFDLGMRLAYIALLPQLEDGRTEEEVVRELIKSGMSDEAASHCTAQYLKLQNELGKSLTERLQAMGISLEDS